MLTSMETKKSLSPYLAISGAILAVSTASIFIRFAQREGTPSIVIASFRMFFAALIMLPFALIRSRLEIKTLSKRQWILISLSGLLLALHFASWISSLEYTSIASSVVIVTTAPLWVALASPLFLKERIRRGVVFGLLVALVGGIIVGVNRACQFDGLPFRCEGFPDSFGGKELFGNFLALLGALFSAGYLIVGRRVRRDVSLITYTSLVYGIAAVLLIIVSLVMDAPLFQLQPSSYLWCLGLAVIPQLLGHSTFNWALKYLSAAYVSIALLGEPIGTVILAFILLKENPTILELAGGVLILLGIYLASRVENKISENPLPS
jgi:drug/metabolite transporter (DMT)-like permease